MGSGLHSCILELKLIRAKLLLQKTQSCKPDAVLMVSFLDEALGSKKKL